MVWTVLGDPKVRPRWGLLGACDRPAIYYLCPLVKKLFGEVVWLNIILRSQVMRRQLCTRLWQFQASPTHIRSFSSSVAQGARDGNGQSSGKSASATNTTNNLRNPRSAQAVHLKPLKRSAEYGVPSCDLQLRSYSLQPLEFFSDFALRAAYYLGLPAFGPVPLPRITERWTVPRDHFIFKKSQENFERITLRRMIQIQDGHPETVQLWLAYLRKHQYYGIGMKANFWEFGPTGLSKSSDQASIQPSELESAWEQLGQARPLGTPDKVTSLLDSRRNDEDTVLKRPRAVDQV